MRAVPIELVIDPLGLQTQSVELCGAVERRGIISVNRLQMARMATAPSASVLTVLAAVFISYGAAESCVDLDAQCATWAEAGCVQPWQPTLARRWMTVHTRAAVFIFLPHPFKMRLIAQQYLSPLVVSRDLYPDECSLSIPHM